MKTNKAAGALNRGSCVMRRKILMIGAISLALTFNNVSAQAANNKTKASEELPAEVQEACEYWGDYYNICPELLESICYHETRYWSDAENGPCRGIMQINEPCHQDRMKELGVTDLFNYDQNIEVGADYLAELFETYEDVAVVIMMYHGESNAVEKANSGRLSKYCKNILKKSEELERDHGKKKRI